MLAFAVPGGPAPERGRAMSKSVERRVSWVVVTALVALGPLGTLVGAPASAADPVSVPAQVPAPAGVELSRIADAALSADGRWVAYAGRSVGGEDLYLFDRTAGVTRALEVGVEGELSGLSISADGTRIAFSAGDSQPPYEGEPSQVHLFDVATDATSLLSGVAGEPGNGPSYDPDLSEDGTVVAYTTRATDLTAGTGGPGSDVVAQTLATGAVALVSGGNPTGDSSQPSISGDGSRIAFASTELALVRDDTDGGVEDVLVRERSSGALRLVSTHSGFAEAMAPAISADGAVVSFARRVGTTKGHFVPFYGTFTHDLGSGRVERIDVNDEGAGIAGVSAASELSADGQTVLFSAYQGDAGTLSEVYVRDRAPEVTRALSRSTSPSFGESLSQLNGLSGDGRWALFTDWPDGFAGDPRTLWLIDADHAPVVDLVPAFPVLPSPVNLSIPVISPVSEVTKKSYAYTVTRGRWTTGSSGFRSYQWLRNGVEIPGAVDKTYVLSAEDFGARISVIESVELYDPGSFELYTRGEATSGERVARKPGTRLSVRATKKRVRAGRPVVLKLVVAHDFGVRPQGTVLVKWGKRSRRVAVDADGRMTVRVKGVRRGVRVFRVTHRGTATVAGAKVVRVKVRVVRR